MAPPLKNRSVYCLYRHSLNMWLFHLWKETKKYEETLCIIQFRTSHCQKLNLVQQKVTDEDLSTRFGSTSGVSKQGVSIVICGFVELFNWYRFLFVTGIHYWTPIVCWHLVRWKDVDQRTFIKIFGSGMWKRSWRELS